MKNKSTLYGIVRFHNKTRKLKNTKRHFIAILLVNRGCILHLITLLLKYRATDFDIRQILLSLRVNTRKTWRYKNFMPRFAREIISNQRPLIIQNRKNQGAINSNRANRLILAPKLEKHPPFVLKRDQLQAFWPMARNFQPPPLRSKA